MRALMLCRKRRGAYFRPYSKLIRNTKDSQMHEVYFVQCCDWKTELGSSSMGKHSKGKHAVGAKALTKENKGAPVEENPKGSAGEGVTSAEMAEEKDESAQNGSSSDGVLEPESASADASDASDEASAVLYATDGSQAYSPEIAVKKDRKGLKIAGIVLGVLIGLLLIIYLAGVWFFSTHFLPNTSIVGIDFSLKTPSEMQQTLNDKIEEYSFTVVGEGLNFNVEAGEADLNIDKGDLAQVLLTNTNPWAWPVEIFESRDETEAFTQSLSASKLGEIVNEEVAKVNEGAEGPKNAFVEFDDMKQKFVVKPEQIGTMLETDAVLDRILSGAMSLDPKIVLTSDLLVQPTVLSNDERLEEQAEKANELVGKGISLKMDGYDVVELTPSTIASWVVFTPEFDVELNNEAMNAWATEISDQCNTVGTTRSYTRPDGKNISVSGGVYGWEIDGEALVEQVSAAVLEGETDVIDIPVLQSGTGFEGLGGKDWGARYADVDLSEQVARLYDDSGNIIWSAPIVSGAPNGHATPTGVWTVNNMASPSTLIGAMTSAGVPEYKTKVSYWMPFQGNAIGFHDATWQSAFGGSRYRQGYGSHGCINLSLNDAASLYGMLRVGDVVVTHY